MAKRKNQLEGILKWIQLCNGFYFQIRNKIVEKVVDSRFGLWYGSIKRLLHDIPTCGVESEHTRVRRRAIRQGRSDNLKGGRGTADVQRRSCGLYLLAGFGDDTFSQGEVFDVDRAKAGFVIVLSQSEKPQKLYQRYGDIRWSMRNRNGYINRPWNYLIDIKTVVNSVSKIIV